MNRTLIAAAVRHANYAMPADHPLRQAFDAGTPVPLRAVLSYRDPATGRIHKTALSGLQHRIIHMLIDGYRQNEIAAELGIAHKTVISYTGKIKDKLGAETVTQAAVIHARSCSEAQLSAAGVP